MKKLTIIRGLQSRKKTMFINKNYAEKKFRSDKDSIIKYKKYLAKDLSVCVDCVGIDENDYLEYLTLAKEKGYVVNMVSLPISGNETFSYRKEDINNYENSIIRYTLFNTVLFMKIY